MTDIAQTRDQPSRVTRNYTLAMLVAIYASSHVDRQIVSILAESIKHCLLYTSPSPRDRTRSRMPSSA